VRAWCDREGVDQGATINLPTTWRLGRAWYHDRLDEDWHPRSVQEGQAILTSLGLVGEPWTLPGAEPEPV
jgi:hypothetical protein